MSICSFWYIFVVHYVSHFYYSSDYYSSSYSGIFWPVISVVSHSGSKQGLDSILTDSLKTLELDTSLEEPDAVYIFSLFWFLCLVSTLSDNSEPQLAPSIHTCQLWCQARALLAHVCLATKMSASKLIHYFSSHPAAFGFWASTPPDNISLNSANRKADQSLSDFQTGIGATAHATCDTEQLISHLQVALVDTLSPLPEAEGDVVPVSEVHELLLWIPGILDKAVSKRVGNLAHILAHLFNSISRQCCEVWASQFPFHHSLKEVIPPSEACLYGCINWSLVQAHSVDLSQSFPPKRGGKARPWTGFQFTVQKRPMSGSVPGTSGASLPKQPHLESGNEAGPGGRKSTGGTVSTSSTESRRKGGHEVSPPDVPEPSTSSSSSSSTCTTFQVGMLFKFFDQWRSITSNRFVLSMVWGHHLQLRSHPPLFCDFWHFNVKVAAAHHPVIQKEVDELLAKGAVEPSSGGAGFYSSMFVVPKHTGGLHPILNLKCFNHFMHISSFKMPTLKHVWQLIQQGDYAFSH